MSALAGLSVLLLEDEFLIALEAEDMLLNLGVSKVTIASTLDDAMRLVSSQSFDVAVLDVNVNGAMSFPLAAELRQKGVPVLFATGYELRARPDVADPTLTYVTKPYTADRLAKGVRQVLARAAAELKPA
jgi:DNA-binding response OmpR family regulator